MPNFNDPDRLKTLNHLVPDARQAFEALMAEATRRGFIPSIVSAVRNCSEQGDLALTKAKRSWHVFGRAVDIELHLGAPKDDPAKFYRELGDWWEQQGGTWGGRWTTLYPQAPGVPGAAGDVLHFQWTPPPLTVGPPESLWPKDAACDVVQANADRYLADGGQLPSSPVPLPVTPAPPAPSSSDSKKKAQLPGLWFWCWGHLLRRRISGRADVATLSGELW